ncbi:MAG TPA: serine hydrolase domain-containing protein [Sphingomicrobium sp.]|jgi:CubicO group peptidase (beta-lactamase class C family)
MLITRRAFTGGALSVALGSQLAGQALAQNPKLAGALAAINAYGEEHLRHFRLPGMTLGVTTPGGLGTVMNFGYANADARTPITPETLFQVGSISKLMNAALLHQFVGQGRLRLTDLISDLLPTIPLPQGNAIQVQHLLDHVAGIPGDAPTFPEGGLWTAYAPGEHWHYSNTGYEILGKLLDHLGGKPIARQVEERLFLPLGMTRSHGAIIGADRARYAQGYEAVDELPFALGVPLAPAGWVDVTFGAGNIASTADDMTRLLRSLANAVQGRGGMGLSPEGGRTYATHAVPSDAPGMSYGNGIMHTGAHGRSYLHHTGGMVSFSSSFHIDVASGVGAFASSTISAFAEYRPRLLTQFAVDALTNAEAGRPLPTPPSLSKPLAHTAAYVGKYAGPAGAFEVMSGNPLTLVANGQSAPLVQWDDQVFRTTHPAFRAYSFLFDRKGNVVTTASWGPQTYVRGGGKAQLPPADPQLAKLAGRYVNDSPWNGMAPVVERGGKLWVGTDTPMTRIGENLWRIGEDSWSPERGSFANFIDGRPQTFNYSGLLFDRHDI